MFKINIGIAQVDLQIISQVGIQWDLLEQVKQM